MFDFKEMSYCVAGRRGFPLDQALRLWKAKYETYPHFSRDVITHSSLKEFGEFVAEVWDDILPVTVREALQVTNLEERRTWFDCIGPEKLFQSLDPKLLDRKTINKRRTRWDEHNIPCECVYEDTYEMYEIAGEKLFGEDSRRLNPVFAVRCWCTTTRREYWIYVPERCVYGQSSNRLEPDAIRAIAWTIRIDITNPKRIYRQGDIIIAEESEHSVVTAPYHLSAQQYLSLLYAET